MVGVTFISHPVKHCLASEQNEVSEKDFLIVGIIYGNK